MRVRGDRPPPAAFTLEEQPKKPGFMLARFYENVVPFEEKRDDLTMSGFEYDEYHLELADTGDLAEDIANRFEHFLSVAKLMSVEQDPGRYLEFIAGVMEGFQAANIRLDPDARLALADQTPSPFDQGVAFGKAMIEVGLEYL